MNQGLAATINVFAKTDNQTAVRLLLPALSSPQSAIQEGALVALLNRHETAGHREILSRISNLPLRWKTLIQQHSDRMTGMLRTALVEADESLCLNACRAAVMFDDYDVIPALLAAIENGSPAKADMAAETLLQLAAQLHAELDRPRERSDHRDPVWSRQHVLESLQNSVQRFGRHKRREVMEAFLLLVDRDNTVLNQILRNPHHVCFLIMMDVFSKSDQSSIMRLLLSYLGDPHAPSAVLNAISNRSDPKFVRKLLRHVGMDLSSIVRQNLKRIEKLPWLKTGGVIDYLDNSGQYSVVQLVKAAGIPRNLAFATIKHLLVNGKTAGRREAALALADFNGADANALALATLSDPDPQVQASILTHIRQRAIPGILSRLIKFIDSPNVIVRRAAQQSLAEFSFPRFVSSFDLLDEEAQRTTGKLVKKVDPQTVSLLEEELQAATNSRRIRGLRIATALELNNCLESTILKLLCDGDWEVRQEAALALAPCTSVASRHALDNALLDSNETVRRAARKSLQELPVAGRMRKEG